jgi:cell division protein YceG involved in septum cleavage
MVRPAMAEWIYFVHPPRAGLASAMTYEEHATWGVHWWSAALV